jgi:HAD superfamily hydrolase (TIGR01509 family)
MRAVIFDFDGVLVDSEPLHFRSLREALRPEGIEVSPQDYQQVYLAYDDREAIRIALKRHGQAPDAERVEAIALRKARRFEEQLGSIALFPGARELVRALADELPLAIASGALHAEIEAILEQAGLRSAFSAIVGADDVARTKPDPLPYLEAARRLRAQLPDLEAHECLALEDSPPGLLAARAAGMTVVGVAHSYAVARLRGLAHHVVATIGELDVEALRGLGASR